MIVNELAGGVSFGWQVFNRGYGIDRAPEPVKARLLWRREPARFRLLWAEVDA